MYKSNYEPVEGLPLTTTIPLLLEWKGMAPHEIEKATNKAINQPTLHRVCTGETKNPKKPWLEAVASFFGIKDYELHDVEFIKKFVAGAKESKEDSAFQQLVSIASELSSSEIMVLVGTGKTIVANRPAQEPGAHDPTVVPFPEK